MHKLTVVEETISIVAWFTVFIKQLTQIPELWYLPQSGIEDGVTKELQQNAQPLSGGQSERSRVGESTNNTDIQSTLVSDFQ